jgi:diguanylate cyclase (GGDEF)-like protein/PAS domain S-box-containing protein
MGAGRSVFLAGGNSASRHDQSAHGVAHKLSASDFRRRLRNLILLAWNLPPFVGLGFLIYIQMFSLDQIVGILATPLEPAFIIGWMLFGLWYFTRWGRPIANFLAQPRPTLAQERRYLQRLRSFPLHFWGIFTTYILLAPSSVILSAERYTDFTATPVDWFRIHLVALVVSIIVGLPIFFRAMDLLGQTLRGLELQRPTVSLKTRVMLLGALMPLMVDTMIVQYYWTRTGYFTSETFVVWLGLEILAIAGSLLFLDSLRQGLEPLRSAIGPDGTRGRMALEAVTPRSTDELGIIAAGYSRLLRAIDGHNKVLSSGARLTGVQDEIGVANAIDGLVRTCREVVGGDKVFLMLHDPGRGELVSVAQTGEQFNERGYLRVALDEPSLVTWMFARGGSVAIDDVASDPRASAQIRDQYGTCSALGAPLSASGELLGVLLSIETTAPRRYTADDLALIEQVAQETAAALASHRMLKERAAAQDAALESEEQVRLLLDSTVEAIYGADLSGTCTFVNRACVEMLGYDHEDELLGTSIHELIHHSYPDGTHYPKKDCLVGRATRAGEVGHSADEVHWRKDGSALPVEYWSHPVYKDGELMGSVVTFIDISERRSAEQNLKRLNARNELLLESTSDGIIGVDHNLCCTFANRAAAELLGYSQDALVGQDIHQLTHYARESGEPLAREQLPLQQAIDQCQARHAEDAVLWRQDGDPIPVQYSANPIREDGRVTGAVMVFRNIAEARAVARKMDYLAAHDPLTGLFNRREFEARLEGALQAAQRDRAEHALCYIDLDQFKVVNDTCGHEAGDELLRQLGTLLHGRIRQHDMLARLGGDEFGMLLDNCPIDKAVEIADGLRAVVEDYRFAWQDKTFAVGVSIGLVAINADTESLSWAMSAADTACYVAKDRGRNRLHVYELDDAELNLRRTEMQWVSRLNEALDNHQLVLRYQPIVGVDSPDQQHSAIEILVAMRDADGREIPPGAFIPAAERYNLMVAVDRWVVSQVFAWLREHHQQLPRLQRCFINLSGQSIGQEKFLSFLEKELEHGGFPADKLCFEITETAAVANLSRAVLFINSLKTHGCRFALDDFGSGMSSFAYLKTLPLDYLKIDGNFVRDMVSDPIDRAMVQAIHQVGHVMNIATIAEFVEDQAILDELRTIGVDYAQGFGIARPRPLADYPG